MAMEVADTQLQRVTNSEMDRLSNSINHSFIPGSCLVHFNLRLPKCPLPHWLALLPLLSPSSYSVVLLRQLFKFLPLFEPLLGFPVHALLRLPRLPPCQHQTTYRLWSLPERLLRRPLLPPALEEEAVASSVVSA